MLPVLQRLLSWRYRVGFSGINTLIGRVLCTELRLPWMMIDLSDVRIIVQRA